MPSRQEIPGPAKKREPVKQLDTFRKSFQKKYEEAEAKFLAADARNSMDPTEENAAALESARMEAERQLMRLQKTENRQEEIDDSARISKERKSVKETIGKMADAIDAEQAARPKGQNPEELAKELLEIESVRQKEEAVPGYQAKPEMLSKKQKRQAEHLSTINELVDESGVQIPGREQDIDIDVSMDAVEKAWAETIKRDVEKEKSASEIAKAAIESQPKKESIKKQRARVGERIRSDVQAERAAAEMDPARKRSIAKLKKLEAEHAATGDRLQALTGLKPEEAYEKLVLNGGFMARIKRGIAKLGNDPTYELLDTWIESGKKMEEVDREVTGPNPDFGHEVRVRGLSMRADEAMVTEAAIGRDEARRFRKAEGMKPLNTSRPVAEAPDATLMEDIPRGPKTEEDTELEKLSSDYFTGKVYDAEGNRITSEKKVRAPRAKESTAMMGENVENMIREYQAEHASAIKRVRTEYPRAAEVWNSIASRLQGMDQERLDALYGVFGTRDVATAYVLDRAFSDMDSHEEVAMERLAKADKILGIEEVAPKKVKARQTKKAA